jgi:nucleotide-binding universal stress UspA family protein
VRALVWLREESWEGLLDAARELLSDDAELTLLHVADADAEAAASAPAEGLLGRRHPHPRPGHTFEAVSEQAAGELLQAAAARLGRPAATEARRGRLEREVTEAAQGYDVLLVARDVERAHPGPKSLAPPTRFVVDHAPCAVILVWPPA